MKKFMVLFVLLAFVAPVLADDLYPPDFRGDPLSYQAEWDTFTNGTFGTFGTGIYPDYEDAVDDSDPLTYLHLDFNTQLYFDPSPGWAIAPGGGGFYNPLAGATFEAAVINWIDWEPHKFLRIQIVFVLGDGGPPVIMDVIGYDDLSGGGGPSYGRLIDDWGGALDPFTYYYCGNWIIEPNPDWEQILFFLPQGTIIEQIVIDTVSIPEPATMTMLALGGVALLRRRSQIRRGGKS